MAVSVLLYSGLALGLVGAVSCLRPLRFLGLATRATSAAVLAAGALVVLVAVLLPARERRVARPATRLDDFVPVWQFAERHEIRIAAPPAAVERAIREVTAREIRFFRLLTWIRRPRLARHPPGIEGDILAPPADRPILDVALGSGFDLLAEEPGREIVIGTLVTVPREIRSLPPVERERLRAQWTPQRFAELAAPGYAKAGMNFHLAGAPGGATHLVTETRVFATDPGTVRGFAAYWRLIYPGSSLIRRMWLAAIKNRVEAS